MDHSYDEGIDTLCFDCGENATGFGFRRDGTRIYLCRACARSALRHADADSLDGLPDHPEMRMCHSCENVTLVKYVNGQGHCPGCRAE